MPIHLRNTLTPVRERASARLTAVAASVVLAFTIIMATSTLAATKKHGATGHSVKGQSQVSGGFGRFGTVYTLKGQMNYEILSAGYTLDPFVAYWPAHVKRGEKFLVLHIAVKNARDSRQPFMDGNGLYTLVDSHGQTYVSPPDCELASAGLNNFEVSLNPGQGTGQPALHDPLTEAFELPGNARIVKIIVNQSALGMSGDVLRYYIAGATKDEAGEPGDPRNVISGLPSNVADPSDPSGSTPLDPGNGILGDYLPSGNFYIRLDKFEYSTTVTDGGSLPRAGQKFAIATVTVKTPITRVSMFDVSGGDYPIHQVLTVDGDRIKPYDYLKATSDKTAEHAFEPGDEYTFRILFSIDSSTTVKTLTLGTGGASAWNYDVSSVQ
jgi:hypothetical protein